MACPSGVHEFILGFAIWWGSCVTRSLFHALLFFVCPLYRLSLDFRLLITLLVSSKFPYFVLFVLQLEKCLAVGFTRSKQFVSIITHEFDSQHLVRCTIYNFTSPVCECLLIFFIEGRDLIGEVLIGGLVRKSISMRQVSIVCGIFNTLYIDEFISTSPNRLYYRGKFF